MDDSSKTEKEHLAEDRATKPRKPKLKRESQDITERKRVEEALRESEERYHAIFEQAADAVVIFDAETKEMVEFNNKAHENLGYSREEFKKLSLFDIEAAESAEEITRHTEKIIREGADTFEAKQKTKHGEIRDVLVSAKVIHIHGKALIQGIWRDITERKKVEEALRESEGFCSSLLDNSPNPILVINPDTSVRYVNPALVKLTGFSSSEIIGTKAPYPWWTEETLHSTGRDLKKAMGKGAVRLEELFKKKNGERFQVEITSGPIIKNGKFMYYLANWIDITERKKAEEQLKTSLKEKEVLISEIHHRVKNNLQVMSSLFKLQSEYIRDKRMLEMLKQSQNRIRAMALIHEKLYQSENVARIDFADYVRSLTGYLFRLYEVSSDAIALKINTGEVSLGIDAAVPCGLIVSELVSNSLKHAFPAGKEGQIRIEFHSDKDNHFTLIVSDNGVGLPKAMDLPNTKSLGLQLVNMLTGQLGGAIELDRTDGTTVKITFTETQEGKDVI
ncbi:MAG TPA: PAS domain S-box protein [Planctomycetes bacterium]|nr:PAS domain S-box protein [Planctomycetota bacterium]